MGEVYKKDKSQPLEKLVSDFVGKYNLHLTNNSDIVSLCKDLGFSVSSYPTKQEGYDGFILVNNTFKVIGIDDNLSPIDRRFLIAHELGHYIKADSKHEEVLLALKDNLNHGDDKSQEEHDADYLAAAILVPMSQFKYELELLEIEYKNLNSELEVKSKIPAVIISFFAKRYRVNEQLIARRIAEVSTYA